MNANELTWSDGLGSRSRRPWLIFIKDGKCTRFQGPSHAVGLAVIMGTTYRKNGKWSYTSYDFRLFPGVKHLSFMSGWETGTFLEGLAKCTSKKVQTWLEVAEALDVSLDEAQRFVRLEAPSCALKLDALDAQLQQLAAAEESAQ